MSCLVAHPCAPRKVCERIEQNGEPGFAWLENMRAYGRMGDGKNDRDAKAMGGNPCLEQTLESFEMCCLVETFPDKHESLEDFLETLRRDGVARDSCLQPWEPLTWVGALMSSCSTNSGESYESADVAVLGSLMLRLESSGFPCMVHTCLLYSSI